MVQFELIYKYKDQLTIKIYDLMKECVKQILISQELYDEIVDYKNELTATNYYHKSTRETSRDQIDYGHFMFCDSKGSITKKLNENSKEFSQILI